ncbi:MAG: hypothetical protein SNG81_07020 [Rikenellaceae bacterium]
MKSKFYIAVAALFAVACNPITTDVELTNSFDKDNIVLKAYQTTSGSNEITLRMESEGITGYWDYTIGTKYSDECTFIFPYTGTHTFTYYVTTPYIIDGDVGNTEYVAATIDVEVTTMDTALADAYYHLVGSDLGGKTWVFDTSASYYWTMVDGSNSGSVWWSPAGDWVFPGDLEGKMYFNVSGGANYDYYSSADATPVNGNFVFNGSYTTLSFPTAGADILGSNGGSTTYEIITLTDDTLVLFSSYVEAYGTGWLWSYKPQE